MKSIYELQQIANRLRAVTEADSISPEDTFGLQSDVLAYIAGMEQSADGLGIRKAYVSVAAMNADNTTPIGINGKVLRLGQLVTIYDPDSPLSPDTGNIYAFQNPGWKLVGHTMPESKFLRLLQGIDENNSAYTDPFISLGELSNWQKLSEVLNTLYEKKYMGRCRATVAGMNIEVYQFVQNFENKTFSQVVLGNVAPSEDGTQVVIKTVEHFDILARYCINEVWSAWESVSKQNIPVATPTADGLMSAADKRAVDNMPRPQDTASATDDSRRYVYSVDNPDAKNSVLNAPDTLIKQVNGQLMFQKGLWNPLGQAIYYTRGRIPLATAGADGAMAREVFARLGADYPLREYQPTTVKVPIIYPDWAAGGTRTFDLLPATSARAGVMTAADKEKLDGYPAAEDLTFLSNDEPLVEADAVTIYTQTASGESEQGIRIEAATTEHAGVMSAADKRKVDNMPQPQDTASATAASRRYVYSVDNPDAKNSVLNAPDTLIRQVNGQLMFQKGLWNPLGQDLYYTRGRIPVATAGADGALSKEVFDRLGTGGTLREGTPTTLKVPVVYPNWADGGTRTFDLLPATSARAGMMTAADKEKLEQIYSNKPLTIKHAYFATGNKTAGITEIDGNYTSEDIALVFGNDNRIFEKIYGQINNGLQILFLSRYNESGGVRVVAPVQVSIEKVIAGTETIYHLDLILPCEGETGYGLKSLNLGYNEANGVYIVY